MSLARYDGEFPIPQEVRAQILEKDKRGVSTLRKQREHHEAQRTREENRGAVVNGSSEGALHNGHNRKPGSVERRFEHDLFDGADYEDGSVEVSEDAERSWAFGIREDYLIGGTDIVELLMEADFEELAQTPGLPSLDYRIDRSIQEAVEDEIDVFESTLTALDLRE